MEEARPDKPPEYSHSHDPESLHLPSVPTEEPAATSATEPIHLPDLKSLGLPDSTTHSRNTSLANDQYHTNFTLHQAPDIQQWQSSNPAQHVLFPRVPSHAPRSAAELDMASPMDTESIMSMDEQTQNAAQGLSINSKELMAAEAIVGLGNPDYMMSPSTLQSQASPHPGQEQEPLLSLLTSSHPWLGGTINNSMSAYSTTKAYSPRFIRYSADYIERNVANTVGTVGRRTGVEGSLRRYLGDRRPSDHNSPNGHKRRRVENDSMDIEQGLQTPLLRTVRQRGDSEAVFGREEVLPPYDSNRSPEYEERTNDQSQLMNSPNDQHQSEDSRPVHWSTRVMITTSGLGAALSDKSLRSLKFCLNILRQASAHLGNVMRALRIVLSDYESSTRPHPSDSQTYDSEKGQGVGSRQLQREFDDRQRERHARILADRIKTLSEDIWQTLKNVVASVSRYTGGALPDNAGALVRRQLLSVPQRWQAASASAASSQGPEHDGNQGVTVEVRTANRMLAFATEGLDMMAQVAAVVEGTISSAEQWLDSLGRKRARSEEPRDEKMGELPGPVARMQQQQMVQQNPQGQHPVVSVFAGQDKTQANHNSSS